MSEERPNHIRRLRRAADLTQDELAKLAGVHPQHLGDLERGKYSPTLATAQAIATALKVTVDELFLAAESGTSPDNSTASAPPDNSTASAPATGATEPSVAAETASPVDNSDPEPVR